MGDAGQRWFVVRDADDGAEILDARTGWVAAWVAERWMAEHWAAELNAQAAPNTVVDERADGQHL